MTNLTKSFQLLTPPGSRFQHLDVLDGLRGLAVLIVLLSHLSNVGMYLLPGMNFSGTGKSGVYLFFVLSAFLLTRALAEKPLSALQTPALWLNYGLRRVLRIWPLYLLLLLLSWTLTAYAPTLGWHYVMDTEALLDHLTLQAGQSVLWSIPVEFKYYGLLPGVALVFSALRQWRVPAWVEAALVAASLYAITRIWPPELSQANDVQLGPYLAVFICGAYAAAVQIRLHNRSDDLAVSGWVAIALVAGSALILTIPSVWQVVDGLPFNPQLNHRWFLFFGVVWSALLLALLNGPNWLRWPFNGRLMRLLGVVSFSAYLWHMPLLDAQRALGWGDSLWSAWLFLLLALGLASVSYLAFERPWRDVGWKAR